METTHKTEQDYRSWIASPTNVGATKVDTIVAFVKVLASLCFVPGILYNII